MEAYAVLETGGKQTLVRVGDKIEIEKIAVEEGKDADYLVLKENLLEISAVGMKDIVPEDVYFKGVKVNG